MPPCLGWSEDEVGAVPPVPRDAVRRRRVPAPGTRARTATASLRRLSLWSSDSLHWPPPSTPDPVPDEKSSSASLRPKVSRSPSPTKVEREHRDHDREAGIDDEVRRREVVRLSLTDHLAPGRRRRLDAEADVAQRRLEEDRRGQAEAGIDEDHRHEVRQDVADQDAVVPCSP